MDKFLYSLLYIIVLVVLIAVAIPIIGTILYVRPVHSFEGEVIPFEGEAKPF